MRLCKKYFEICYSMTRSEYRQTIAMRYNVTKTLLYDYIIHPIQLTGSKLDKR